MVVFSVGLYTVFPLGMSYKDNGPTGVEPTLMTSFNLSYLSEVSVSK